MRRIVVASVLALALAGGAFVAGPDNAGAAGCKAFGQGISGDARSNVPLGEIIREFVPQGGYVEQGQTKACNS
jgi:hypothetical protein